ncbi:MAG: hypothetical protein WCH40_06270 [Verrucomicrobiales bacterium]
MRLATSLLLALSLSAAHARPWKSSDGKQTLDGEFVSRDASQVTLKRPDGKTFTIAVAKLHLDDIAYLNKNHPEGGGKAEAPANAAATFDPLVFGDTRQEVEAKLRASRFVELAVEEAFLGRYGLNGSFKTRKQIGGKSYLLYFEWNADNKLKEITLQTEGMTKDAYAGPMQASWKELADVLSSLYGKPFVAGPYPAQASLHDGSFVPSHSWKLSPGIALLGTAQDGASYQVVVRFKKDATGIVEIP